MTKKVEKNRIKVKVKKKMKLTESWKRLIGRFLLRFW